MLVPILLLCWNACWELKGGFILALSLKVQSVMVGESWEQEQPEVAVRKRQEKDECMRC